MAVLVTNACKNYGSAPVLENLSLTVKQGTIYGLLGASGCGKTTLLSCLVGLRTLDSGSIRVFGCRPGRKGGIVPGPLVGYMPQEPALYPMFTVTEVLAYYGTIYGMTSEEIKNRTEFLIKFLHLPKTSRRLDTFSGGQERRVSLAICLIHQPPLLILDEPTVGLDPLLRQSIWEHMTELVKSEDKTTIVITTHYLEETIACDTVSVMRRGHLLAEQNPQVLMATYGSNSLKSIVLDLCQDDEEKNGWQWRRTINSASSKSKRSIFSSPWPCVTSLEDDEEFPGVQLKNYSTTLSTTLANNNDPRWKKYSGRNSYNLPKSRQLISSNLNIITTMAKKNLVIQARHWMTVVAQLLIPVMQIVLINMTLGRESYGINMAYVSKDWNAHSKSIAHQSLIDFCSNDFKRNSTDGTEACFKNEMSGICTFLNQFDVKDFTWIPTSTVQESLELIQNGKAVGYIEFPTNFTRHVMNRVMYRNFADNATIDGSGLKMRLDFSNALSGAWIINTVLNRYLGYMRETAISCGQDPKLVELPLKYNAIYGSLEGQEWIMSVQPAIIIMLTFLLSGMSGIVLVEEKRIGVLDRGTAAGIQFGHIVGACFLSDILVLLGQIVIMFSLMTAFYGMHVEGSWTLAVGIVILTGLAGQSLGFVWASVCKDQMMDIVMIYLFQGSLLIICSGTIWPLESVSSWFRSICFLLPISMPLVSLRGIVFQGWGLNHPIVQQGFAGAIFWIVAFLGIALFINRRRI